VRPNIECTNGIIHTVDTVFIDDAPPWTVGRAAKMKNGSKMMLVSVMLVWGAIGL
jgi:hypothetical protein